MPRCRKCNRTWQELPDEHGDHDCPSCGGSDIGGSLDELAEKMAKEVFDSLPAAESEEDASEELASRAHDALMPYDGEVRRVLWEAIYEDVRFNHSCSLYREAARRLLDCCVEGER